MYNVMYVQVDTCISRSKEFQQYQSVTYNIIVHEIKRL